jgi:protein TonB
LLRRADLITVALAVVVHVGVAVVVMRAEKPPPKPRAKSVVLEFARRPPPAPPQPVAPKIAAAPTLPARTPTVRKVALRSRPTPARAAASPAAALAPATPPAAAPPPIYAVAMASTTEVSSAVAVAGSRTAGAGSALGRSGAPGGRGTGPSGEGDGTGYHPVSAGQVGSMPDVDVDACGRAATYPREAEESGTEGEVRLRVSLTEEGRVHAVRVLSGLGHGLDAAAVDAIKNRCKFKPAIGRDGQPVAFVIESYKFHFELPR